jgi:hypothetical protein
MVVSAAALALVEVGYVAWLERLSAFPSPANPTEFLDLPLWYEHPRVGVTLLLTVLGGMIAWAAWSVFGFMRNRSHGTVAATQRAMANKRLKATALCAVVAGSDFHPVPSYVNLVDLQGKPIWTTWHLATGGQHTRR